MRGVLSGYDWRSSSSSRPRPRNDGVVDADDNFCSCSDRTVLILVADANRRLVAKDIVVDRTIMILEMEVDTSFVVLLLICLKIQNVIAFLLSVNFKFNWAFADL